MLNRAAVLLKYKAPAIKWVNEADPYDDNPQITEEHINKERTVYLITEDDAEDITAWIKRNYKNLFESELNDWYTDSELWPSKRTLKVFHEWFEVECHSVITDTVSTKLIDDEI